jgi:hypothetical protein
MRVWNPELPDWDPTRDRYAFMLTLQEDGTWEDTAVKQATWANVIEGITSWQDLPVSEWKRGCIGQKIMDDRFQVRPPEENHGLVSP